MENEYDKENAIKTNKTPTKEMIRKHIQFLFVCRIHFCVIQKIITLKKVWVILCYLLSTFKSTMITHEEYKLYTDTQ